MNPAHIKQLLETHIENCAAIIESDDNIHFKATVISSIFNQKTRLEQQKLVYAALGNTIDNGAIHAISVKTYTPETWAALSADTPTLTSGK